MATLTTDGPPWHCDDFGDEPVGDRASPPAPLTRSPGPAAARKSARTSRRAADFLPFADRLAIGLIVFAAIGLLIGAQNASPSHSRELAPIIVTVPMR